MYEYKCVCICIFTSKLIIYVGRFRKRKNKKDRIWKDIRADALSRGRVLYIREATSLITIFSTAIFNPLQLTS